MHVDVATKVPSHPGKTRVPTTFQTAIAHVVLGWAVTTLAYAAGLAWLIPVAVWLTVASLIRGGRTLLDRLMLALALLLAFVPVAGILFTLWPFGLHPIAVGGTAFTVLAGYLAVSGRALALPRPAWRDLPAPAAGVIAAVMVGLPFRTLAPTQAVARFFPGEDGLRHFSAFDAISRSDGYLYLEPARADVMLAMIWYPEGWHLTSALLDRFAGAAAGTLAVTDAMSRYWLFSTLTFGLLVLAIAWGASWLAGRYLSLTRQLVVTGVIVAIAVFAELSPLALRGFPAEVAGLVLLALLVAVTCRPAGSFRQQLLLVSGLFAAVGLTYYVFLPLAWLLAFAWLLRNHRRTRAHLTLVVCTIVSALLVAVIPLAVILVRSTVTFEAVNGVAGYDRPGRIVVGALAISILAGLLTRRGRRLPVWRSYRWAVLFSLAVLLFLYLYQMRSQGHTSYYYFKLVHASVVIGLTGASAAVLLLPSPRDVSSRLKWTAALSVMVLALAVPMLPLTPSLQRSVLLAQHWHRDWPIAGLPGHRLHQDTIFALTAANGFAPLPDRPTFIVGEHPVTSYALTLQMAVLQRNTGAMPVYCYPLDPHDLSQCHAPARLIAASPAAADAIQRYLDAHPERDFELVTIPGQEAHYRG